jgi:hypothetical protein
VKRPQAGRKPRYDEDDDRPGAEEPGPEDEMSDDDIMQVDKKPENLNGTNGMHPRDHQCCLWY